VARVKACQEKALAWVLARLGVGYDLPQLEQPSVRRDSGKTRKSVVCLFPGCLPIVGYRGHRPEVLRTSRVVQVLEVRGQTQFVRELEAIRNALGATEQIEVQSHLAVGQLALVTGGPMRGIEGIVTDASRRDRLVQNTEMFQRSVVVIVAPRHVVVGPGARAIASRIST
jgi:hypothetical protein